MVWKFLSQNNFSGFFVSFVDWQTANCQSMNLPAIVCNQVWWRQLSNFLIKRSFWWKTPLPILHVKLSPAMMTKPSLNNVKHKCWDIHGITDKIDYIDFDFLKRKNLRGLKLNFLLNYFDHWFAKNLLTKFKSYKNGNFFR